MELKQGTMTDPQYIEAKPIYIPQTNAATAKGFTLVRYYQETVSFKNEGEVWR